jgi:hypothetical protein
VTRRHPLETSKACLDFYHRHIVTDSRVMAAAKAKRSTHFFGDTFEELHAYYAAYYEDFDSLPADVRARLREEVID